MHRSTGSKYKCVCLPRYSHLSAILNHYHNTALIAMETSPSSGISILISGGGLAGLACAIESHRKGHKVRVLEGRPDFNEHGMWCF